MSKSRNKLALLAKATLATWALIAASGTIGAEDKAIDPDSVYRLQASMDYLASLQTFSLETDSTIEVVLEGGQKIQFDNASSATVKRPNKFYAKRLGDLVDQEFFYDGKVLTLQDSMAGFHASIDAPDTLEGMLDFARDSLDIVAPAGDFIYSNSFDLLMEGVESGFYIGPSFVEGVVCDHLAFSSPGTDWQVWIERGDKPLPRRIVITSRDVLNAPQFTVHISNWDISPKVSDADFNFNEHKDSAAIEFMTIDTADSK